MNSPSPRPAPSPAPLPSARQAQTHFLLLFDPDSARADDWRRRLAPLDCPVLVANDWPAMLALAQQVPVGLVVCAAAPGLASATRLLQRLRQRLTVMPPVVLVGPALADRDIAAGREAGAAEVLIATATDRRLVERLAQHWLERAPVTADRLPQAPAPPVVAPMPAQAQALAQDLHVPEQGQILAALERFAGHRLRAAAHLGMSPGAFADRLSALRAAGVVLPA